MHPFKNHRKLLQKMCSFSFLKCLGKDKERITVVITAGGNTTSIWPFSQMLYQNKKREMLFILASFLESFMMSCLGDIKLIFIYSLWKIGTAGLISLIYWHKCVKIKCSERT